MYLNNKHIIVLFSRATPTSVNPDAMAFDTRPKKIVPDCQHARLILPRKWGIPGKAGLHNQRIGERI
jgi:hypothetical protein